MTRKVSSKTKLILKYTEQGLSAKEIAKKAKVSAQAVYNAQYKARQRAALASKPSNAGSSGIVAAKKSRGVETGIPSLAKRKPAQTVTVTPTTPLELTKPIVKAKPTLWQRIKQVFGWQ